MRRWLTEHATAGIGQGAPKQKIGHRGLTSAVAHQRVGQRGRWRAACAGQGGTASTLQGMLGMFVGMTWGMVISAALYGSFFTQPGFVAYRLVTSGAGTHSQQPVAAQRQRRLAPCAPGQTTTEIREHFLHAIQGFSAMVTKEMHFPLKVFHEIQRLLHGHRPGARRGAG